MKAALITILAALGLGIVWAFVIMHKLHDEHSLTVQTKQRIEPTVITECSNGNCDTTYVYDFNTKER